MIVNNGIVRILFLLCQNLLKMDPIRLYGLSIGFKIRNIIISSIRGRGCYIQACQNSNSTFNVLLNLVLQITYHSSVLNIYYH